MRTCFSLAIGTLELGHCETLTASLHQRGWQKGVDLRELRLDLVDRTEMLAKAALGALSDGRPSEARKALQEALELW